jgi:hypothetical protein
LDALFGLRSDWEISKILNEPGTTQSPRNPRHNPRKIALMLNRINMLCDMIGTRNETRIKIKLDAGIGPLSKTQ